MSTTGEATPAISASAPAMTALVRRHCSRCAIHAAASAAEHGERRQHEHDMADAVIDHRPRRDRDHDRQRRGERNGEKRGAAAGIGAALAVAIVLPAEGKDQRADKPADAEHQHQFRHLDREQCRHIAARHVVDRDQLAGKELAPRLLENRREIFHRAERIERRQRRSTARPGPSADRQRPRPE